MKLLATLLVVLACLTSGCNDKPERASISTEELLIALDGLVFTVMTPSQVDPEAFGGLAIKRPDGTISPFSSANGLKPRQELKVILLDPKEGSLRYTILGEGRLQRGESTNFPAFSAWAANPQSTRIEAETPLMRFGSGTSVSLPTGELRESEFDLIFHLQEKNEANKPRLDNPLPRPESEIEP